MSETANTTNTAIIVRNVKTVKTATIRPFKGSPDSKKVTLEIDFDGCPLDTVFSAATAHDVIKWQGNHRDKYDTLVDGSTIKRKFSAPPSATITEEQAKQAMKGRLATFKTKAEKMAYLESLLEVDDIEVDDSGVEEVEEN